MAFVSSRAGRVFYQRRGAGPAVVMLHANLHDHRDFDPVADALSASYTTVAVDWPGHGRSGTPAAPARVGARLLADTLAEIVDEVAPGPSVFIGNSVGGFAAARLAIDRPDRVAGLVLVNAGGFTGQTAAERVFCRLLGVSAVARVVQPALVPRYMRSCNDHDRAITRRVRARARTADGARVCAGLWRSFGRPEFDLRAQAGRIAAPTLLVWGTRDIVLPLRVGEETRRAIAGASLHTFDTGHVVFASDPDGFLGLVEPFLRTVTRP